MSKRTDFCLFSVFAALLGSLLPAAAHGQTPTLTVDAASNQHPINPDIYGVASYGLDAAFAEEIKVSNVRWGGDATTRYNWRVDSSNAGFDWYFMGGNGESDPVPGASADLMVATYKPAGAGALITIPIIPYVNKLSAWNCSFPTSVYGAQQSTNPYVHPNGENCGNNISSSGTQLKDTDILANHIPNSVALQQSWIEHLVAKFANAARGGVPFYQLDNEPDGWSNTHRDIEPTQPAYSVIVSLGQEYAAMVKKADPTAMVLGPSDFTLGGWIGTPSAQNGLFAGQYYLRQMAAYDKKNGVRLLDYFDEHYYPQFTNVATQLASTRTLWDPTYNSGTWVEKYYFDGPMQLIPRFQKWIATYYPGTKLAFSEYSIDSGNKVITDAIAEADVLGIFGRQQVDFANMWSAPAPTDPISYAFRLYRNYDGKGSAFGGASVEASSSNQGQMSIYAATRATDGALTLVVLNKTATAIDTKLSILNFKSAGSAAMYSYSAANLTKITSQGSVSLVSNALTYSYPAYSATVIVVAGAVKTEQPIPTGGHSLKNNLSSYWMDNPGGSSNAGVQVIQWQEDESTGQQWSFSWASGYYTIRNVKGGLYLTDPNTAGSVPEKLLQEPLKSTDDQLWSITGSEGAWMIHNKTTGRVIADPSTDTARGADLAVETTTGDKGESWVID